MQKRGRRSVLDAALGRPYTTFAKSGHRAQHGSCSFLAGLRGQSASGSPLEQLRVEAVAHNKPINTVLAGTSALVALDAQHGQLAGDIAECDRAVAWNS